MLLYYTQMGKPGTAIMHVLGIPLYISALVLAFAFSNWGAAWFLGAPTAIMLLYTFGYSKALLYFNSIVPKPSPWWFIIGVLSAELVFVPAIWAAVAAA